MERTTWHPEARVREHAQLYDIGNARSQPPGRADAEDVARMIVAEHALRVLADKLHRVRWGLETARSELRKADPATGYRSSQVLGDAPWSVGAAQVKVDAAKRELLALYEEIYPQ